MVAALPIQLPEIEVTPSSDDNSVKMVSDKGNNVDDLYNHFSGKAEDKNKTNVDDLYNHFSTPQSAPVEPVQPAPAPTPENNQAALNQLAGINRAQFMRGISNVLDTGMHGLGTAAEAISGAVLPDSVTQSIHQENEEFNAADKAKRDQFTQQYGEPNASQTMGEIAATLPLVPSKAISLWKTAVGAAPTIGAAGARITAPIANRMLGAAGEGAIGGATFGAATAGGNDNSTLSNIGSGVITGALAGPAIYGAAELGANALPVASRVWARINVNKLAQNAGIDPVVAKNIIDRLQEAGYSPQTAQAELNKLGPKATLMDLDNSLTTEGSGLASQGGAPTAILKNRMEARGNTANNDIVNVVNKNLGPKPDIEALKEKDIKQVQKDVKPDYDTAYASSRFLDTRPIATDINKQLETAVGGKQQALALVKGYLFKDAKTAEGAPIKVLKTDLPSLHEVRQAIDDIIERKGTPETSAGKNALRALQGVRESLDDLLKSVPAMKAADEKFAAKMDVIKGYQEGHDVLSTRTTKEEFAKTWRNASPEKQETLRKGMTAAVYDKMESAQKGELTGANQQLGQHSANRANLRLAHGKAADITLDELHKEAAFRATENAIRGNSLTAERQAVQRRYAAQAGGNVATDIAHGLVADIAAGSPGIGAAYGLAKRYGGKVMQNVTGNRLERLTTGSADILSQQGKGISDTLDALGKVSTVQNKIIPRRTSKYKLPIAATAAPAGEYGYRKYKSLGQ